MTKGELKERFKQYALQVAFFVLKFPHNAVNRSSGDQLNRSVASAAAIGNKSKIVNRKS